MNAQLAVIEPQPLQAGWDDEQKKLIKATVAKDATDAELGWFFQVCSARNLNPFTKQIWFIKRGGVPTIQTSIDGLRAIANRTGKLQGIKRGTKRIDGQLYAWAEIYRKDWAYPAYEEVSLKEYGAGSPIWNKMPETMLKKCAESAALRMAFPEDLSGLYSDDEMSQADNPAPPMRDPYLQNVGASTINTPAQQDTYKADKKAVGERIKAKREAMELDPEQLQALIGKKLNPNRMTLTELEEIEQFLVDLDTRATLGQLTPIEKELLFPPEEEETIEAAFTESTSAAESG